MDEIFHWHRAVDSPNRTVAEEQGSPLNLDTDLFLANVDDDDFNIWALIHFNGQDYSSATDNSPVGSSPYLTGSASFQAADAASNLPSLNSSELVSSNPDRPCISCSIGGAASQRIQEDQDRGYCASCVAFKYEYDFGLPQLQHGLALPVNSRHPNLQPSDNVAAVGLLGASLFETPQSLPAMDSVTENTTTALGLHTNALPAKIGTRFSRESVRILKKWLILHSRHPYPTEEEKALLQRQTGLNKTQISNWLTNARRKGKTQPQRSTFSHTGRNQTGPMNIPRRPGTPALESNTNPLQRWVDSPPENEPASVSAIARAVASSWDSSPGLDRPCRSALADEDSNRSLGNTTSPSSAGTSSGGSFASAYSHSGSSFRSMNQSRSHRRRRRRAPPKRDVNTSLIAPPKPYQCTFCSETFRTKHDWQRHEKSLHLSLERWVCAPDGPQVINPRTNQVCCVFCGKVDPDDAHIKSHNYSTCKARHLEEKTFYRKDHLNQHLKLVHNVQFLDWCMKTWRITASEIRSRCGFCGITMNSWPVRAEHLGEHYKSGRTMADWKGDWGFDAPVLDMLESAIPPYLIEMERNSTFPFTASDAPTESPRSAYELITIELGYFMVNYKEEMGSLPSDKEMQLDACRIIFSSEVSSLRDISTESSWLRDLLMASEDITRQARFAPLRQGAENRLCVLKINGKDNMFEQCPLELHLDEFVRAKTLLDQTITDVELQEECCCIISRIEDVSITPSDSTANWLVRLIMSSAAWLSGFRQRAHLPKSDDHGSFLTGARNPGSTIHSYSRLESSLGGYLAAHRATGIEPSDKQLEREARKAIYGFDDGWNHTAANNADWLKAFRQRHGNNIMGTAEATSADLLAITTEGAQPQQLSDLVLNDTVRDVRPTRSPRNFEAMMKMTFFINDANCYRRLAQDLTRFVMSTMSPKNPNRHVPTDAEIQHQARWILFDSDDPWNQTAADNDEWLQRFKREVGILPPDPQPT
ncbi:hypothetical protein EDB81DRAFT_661581 [Dactylonectria macrodidyma]|uniref:Uncharacterized protein n=1 Tax=Dactylonectria macrodidyma TaxID=307937 RepID=A0A9P9IQE1_9HYPO|nr:hypothetical protein EDB81DRAFT_661581 [Dactylonectria macrodidyma]